MSRLELDCAGIKLEYSDLQIFLDNLAKDKVKIQPLTFLD